MYNMVDRKNLKEILKEQIFQQSGITKAEYAVEIGKILNVENTIIGTLGKLGKQFILTFTMINVQTGKILYSDKNSCPVLEEAEGMIAELINRIVKKFVDIC